jgi:hypothetical protein
MSNQLSLETLEKHLDTLEAAVRKLTNLQYTDEESLTKMMDNIYNVYSQIVHVLSPFYSIQNEMSFSNDFRRYHDNFRDGYINEETGDVDFWKIRGLHINCDTVGHMISRIVDNKNVKNSEDLTQISRMRPLWFQEDNDADTDLHEFFKQLNNELSKIRSYEDLRALLSGSEFYFKKISIKLEPYSQKRQELENIIKDSVLTSRR